MDYLIKSYPRFVCAGDIPCDGPVQNKVWQQLVLCSENESNWCRFLVAG